jgi:hypothetical protein
MLQEAETKMYPVEVTANPIDWNSYIEFMHASSAY